MEGKEGEGGGGGEEGALKDYKFLQHAFLVLLKLHQIPARLDEKSVSRAH